MKQKRFLCAIILAGLLPITALAEQWTDHNNHVIYECDDDSEEATVVDFEYGVIIGDVEILETITIGNKSYQVTGIADNAFLDCDLTSVTLPSTVTSIGASAFGGCSSLTTIDVSNVTTIGEFAFYGCSSLESFTIPDGLTEISEGMLHGCSRLTEIDIPGNVASIGDGAFSNCSLLATVTIAEGVVSIGSSVFKDCDNLSAITLPASMTDFTSGEAFKYSKIKTVTLKGEDAVNNFSSLDGEIQTVIIDCDITSIGDDAFYGCIYLTSVTLPSTVTSIGESAFSGCI